MVEVPNRIKVFVSEPIEINMLTIPDVTYSLADEGKLTECVFLLLLSLESLLHSKTDNRNVL